MTGSNKIVSNYSFNAAFVLFECLQWASVLFLFEVKKDGKSGHSLCHGAYCTAKGTGSLMYLLHKVKKKTFRRDLPGGTVVKVCAKAEIQRQVQFQDRGRTPG